jgi:putative membrane protein
MFTISFVMAFTAEALGVNYGLIFGHYHYSAILGPGLVGVPFLAALTWEPILYAAFCITDVLVPYLADKGGSWLQRFAPYLGMAVIAALATTAWDMMIDPIAVSQGWWVWEGGGSYVPYIVSGVPLTNFMGWLGVSFIITWFYRLIADTIPNPRRTFYLSVYGPLTLYSALFLTSLGVTLTVLRRPEVALVGLLAMGPFIAIALTNISLLQHGLAVFQGADGPKIERSE